MKEYKKKEKKQKLHYEVCVYDDVKCLECFFFFPPTIPTANQNKNATYISRQKKNQNTERITKTQNAIRKKQKKLQ